MLRTEIGAWRRLIFLYGAHILRGGFIGSFDRGGHCAAFYFKPTLWVSRWIAARASARAFFYNPHQVGLNIGRTAKSKWDEPFALRNQVSVENTIVQVGIKLPEWNYCTGWRSRNRVLQCWEPVSARWISFLSRKYLQKCTTTLFFTL